MQSKYSVYTFEGGMSKATSERSQPKGTYPYALNMVPVKKDTDEDQSGLIDSKGNRIVINLPGGAMYVGSILTTDAQHVIFSTDNTNSYIGLYNANTEEYRELIRDNNQEEKLNFSNQHPITGVFKIRRGCDR